MGKWTLLSATPDITDRNDLYGHYFQVTFRIKYSPSTFGSFVEMPRLEWKETITMVEKNANTWWQFIGDQYARCPNSPTFGFWKARYPTAYDSATKGLYGPNHKVRLYDRNGAQLARTALPRVNGSAEEANAVRSYLKNNGGIMEIDVQDTPAIQKPDGTDRTIHKYRILTFDCGLAGGGPRVAAIQHLVVDATLPEGRWSRECKVGTVSRPFSTTGMNKINPPADVTALKPFMPSPGAYQ